VKLWLSISRRESRLRYFRIERKRGGREGAAGANEGEDGVGKGRRLRGGPSRAILRKSVERLDETSGMGKRRKRKGAKEDVPRKRFFLRQRRTATPKPTQLVRLQEKAAVRWDDSVVARCSARREQVKWDVRFERENSSVRRENQHVRCSEHHPTSVYECEQLEVRRRCRPVRVWRTTGRIRLRGRRNASISRRFRRDEETIGTHP
jgi:hypothetical protein